MTDHEFLSHALKGNRDAIEFAGLLHRVSHVWDDLIDKDPIDQKRINDAFFTALVLIPSNAFFRACADTLLPVMAASCFNYEIANSFEESGNEDRIAMAHTLRYSVADVLVHMVYLIGGHDWLREVGPELRHRAQKDVLSEYRKEVEVKYAQTS